MAIASVGDGKRRAQVNNGHKGSDNDGRWERGFTVIDFKSPDVVNEGLGYCICPDGNQGHAHAVIMEDMWELCDRISSAQLSEKEA